MQVRFNIISLIVNTKYDLDGLSKLFYDKQDLYFTDEEIEYMDKVHKQVKDLSRELNKTIKSLKGIHCKTYSKVKLGGDYV